MYFKFGDFDSRNFLLITDLQRYLPPQKLTTVETQRGVRISNVSFDSSTFKIKCAFQRNNSIFSKCKTLNDARNLLSKELISNEPRKLILSDEPDVFYWAYYDGASSSSTYETGFDYIEFEIAFLIPDSIRHSLKEHKFSADGDLIRVKNNGDLPVLASVDVEFPSNCDYLGFTTQSSITQLGTVKEVDIKKPQNTVIFNDKLEKDVSKYWVTNIAKPTMSNAQLKGKMGQSAEKFGQMVEDFGKPIQDSNASNDDYTKIWHGSSLSRYLGEELQDFFIESRIRFVDTEREYTTFRTSDVKYTVKKSDTVSSIAKKYNVDSKFIRSWNGFKSDKDINNKVGKQIIVGKKNQTVTVDDKNQSEMQYYYAGVNDTVQHACSIKKVSEDNFRAWNRMKPTEEKLKEGHPYIVKKGSSKTAFKNGCTQFQAVDADNNIIAGIEIKDNTEGFNKAVARFYIGNETVMSKDIPREYLDLYADLSIKKIGNRFTLALKVIDEKTQKQVKDKKGNPVQFVKESQNEDSSMLSLKRVDYIGMVYRNVYKESRAIYQSFTHCRVTKIENGDPAQEVFTFVAGDKLTLEGTTPYINGVENINYSAIGSEGILIPPGESEVYYTYPQTATQPNITLRLREDYY